MAEKRNIIVSGYAYPSISTETLDRWLPDLTLLDTFSYGITPEGGLVQLDDQNLINAANRAGIKPMMVLTPMDETGMFSDRLAAQVLSNPAARDNLVNNIEANVKSKGLFGVDFDFEYIPVVNRDQYTALIGAAAERLNPQGYMVTAALAPKTSTEQAGLLYQGHDYYGVGQAANLVLLMTYEWGYTFGPPMAVSPINQVRKVLDYGVTQISPEKILMGMPNYGYDWPLPFVKGTTRAEKITNGEGFTRAARYGVPVQFDPVSQAPNYHYYDNQGVDHEVWFDNEASIKARLSLVNEYGLAGVGYWNIMDFDPNNSKALNEMFNVVKL